MTEWAILSTTTASAEEARRLAGALVEARHAACVQIVPIQSVYVWKRAVEEAAEHLLLCKIAAATFPAVADFIAARHGYEVPELVLTPMVQTSDAYAHWLGATLGGPGA